MPSLHRECSDLTRKNGSHYRASEVISLISGVFKNIIERILGQNKNNRSINLPKVITFSTDSSTPPNPSLYHTQYIYNI